MAGCGCGQAGTMGAMCRYKKLLVEMAVVGLVLLAVFALLARAAGVPASRPTLRLAFVAGAVGHALLEATGLNAWYAQQYTPLL